MYPNSNCLMVLEQDSVFLVRELTQALQDRGIDVTRSFDLQATRSVHNGCSCPYHGTDQCNCQLMVLLVYKNEQSPLTLVLEGRNQHTWISVVYTPGQAVDNRLINLIIEVFRFANSKRVTEGVEVGVGN